MRRIMTLAICTVLTCGMLYSSGFCSTAALFDVTALKHINLINDNKVLYTTRRGEQLYTSDFNTVEDYTGEYIQSAIKLPIFTMLNNYKSMGELVDPLSVPGISGTAIPYRYSLSDARLCYEYIEMLIREGWSIENFSVDTDESYFKMLKSEEIVRILLKGKTLRIYSKILKI